MKNKKTHILRCVFLVRSNRDGVERRRMVGVKGLARTHMNMRLRGIRNDLIALCLSNLLIVEPMFSSKHSIDK